jgi:hypothetical protein
MSHPNPAVVFPRIVYSFFLSWAAELAARLKQEDKEANSNWVPSIISPKTLRPISVDRESIQANLDWEQAAALADKPFAFPHQPMMEPIQPVLPLQLSLEKFLDSAEVISPSTRLTQLGFLRPEGFPPKSEADLAHDGSVF